ncbi:MAG: neutral zinc metallopeptidase, partial [Gemmatimonadota bacterium]|nr:neutral zinc metallopeptidase [Gemmatimonadota bacterium]
MRWKRGKRSANIEDRRGARGRLPVGRRGGLSLGGLLLVLVLGLVFKQDVTSLLGLISSGSAPVTAGPVTSTPEEDLRVDLVSFVLDDAQGTWAAILPQLGRSY